MEFVVVGLVLALLVGIVLAFREGSRSTGIAVLLLCALVCGLIMLGFIRVPVDLPVSGTCERAQGSSVVGCPSLSPDFVDRVLSAYGSPAQGEGEALYTLSQQYHIDDVYALAFFLHESSMGKSGVARYSMSLGNLRCISEAVCRDGFAWFPSWRVGFEAWYRLISGPVYVGSGLSTVEQIIPRYAPAADHNNEWAYIRAVEQAVSTWRAGRLLVTGER